MRIYDSIEELIGSTPLVRLHHIEKRELLLKGQARLPCVGHGCGRVAYVGDGQP